MAVTPVNRALWLGEEMKPGPQQQCFVYRAPRRAQPPPALPSAPSRATCMGPARYGQPMFSQEQLLCAARVEKCLSVGCEGLENWN